jgi:hypothetical protein
MHPGWADTPGVVASLPTFHRLIGPRLRTPEEGADTIVWLVASEEPARTTGTFWLDRGARPVDRLWGTRVDDRAARRLWGACERLSTSASEAGPSRATNE